MNLPTVKACRQQADACLESRADAVCRVCDGLLTERHARSLPERSYAPCVDRHWPRVSAARADGTIDICEVQARCVRSVLADLPPDALVWIAVDAPQWSARRQKPARIAATSLSPRCRWRTHRFVSGGRSRSVGCCRISQAGGRHGWMCNAFPPLRRPVEWLSSTAGCSRRSWDRDREWCWWIAGLEPRTCSGRVESWETGC
jgi:hypothetical protein